MSPFWRTVSPCRNDGGVKVRAKPVVVPLLVLAIWLLPSSQPEVIVAGEILRAQPLESPSSVFEPLAVAAPTTILDTTPTVDTAAPTDTVASPPPASSTTQAVAPVTTAELSAPPDTNDVASTVAGSIDEQALARVSYDWQARFPDWRVEFTTAREGIRALTYPAERRVEVFVRPSDTAATLHRVFAHELGHLIDVELNDDADRARWLDARGIDQETPWWPSASAPDFDTGAGDFAEAFAVWETGVSSRSTVGDQPDAGDLQLLRELASG